MSVLTEEKLKKLREAGVQVPGVKTNCIGCSACVAIAGDIFDLNEDGLSEVQELDFYDESEVNDSISACPVDAIYWVD